MTTVSENASAQIEPGATAAVNNGTGITRLDLLHSHAFGLESIRDHLAGESIETRAISAHEEIQPPSSNLQVVILDATLVPAGPIVHRDGTAFIAVGWSVDRDDPELFLSLPGDPPPMLLLGSIRRAFKSLSQQHRNDVLEAQLRKRDSELKQVNEIGIALSAVRDHEVLLEMILTKSRELSASDAGSLYLLEESSNAEGKGRVLRWKLAQNESIEVDFEEKILPITKKSLAGFVALTGETLVIDDSYHLPLDVEYTFNRSFDLAAGYRTKSMLVFPMTNHQGDTIGVLQLINRKRSGVARKLIAEEVENEVIGFDANTIELMRSLAGQAAVAVDNSILYDSIEKLFEGFVTAAVTAIEQRDPTTSGHSFRVADLTVELAKTVDSMAHGRFSDIRFSVEQLKEIRYASLLHDFGKVGVREQVLIKEKKLFPLHIESVQMRFHYMMKAIESDYRKRKIEYLLRFGFDDFDKLSRELDDLMDDELAEARHDLEIVMESNEPTILPEGDFQHLQKIARRFYKDAHGRTRPLLSPEEATILSIRKGNLDPEERSEIESHVTHTFDFLSKIPWTRQLQGVPDYAYAHHEKLNGTGYPRKLGAEMIPVQSRMMTVSDIYDALTAADRPYKRAISIDKALDILYMEVRQGLLDNELVDIFSEAKVFERVQKRS